MNTALKWFLRIILPVIVIGGAGMYAKHLVETRPKADRKPPEVLAPAVEVTTLTAKEHPVVVTGAGTVVPARSIVVQAEVSGRILAQHAELQPGGRVSAGDQLIKIDPREHELRVEQQRSQVSNAQFQIKVEQGRKTIAEREWELLKDDVATTASGKALALRKPHIRNARAALAAAKSAVEMAELNVERTAIAVPFNATVQEEYVDPGQLVSPQTRIATLVGTDEFWVRVTLPTSELLWLDIPGINVAKDAAGSEAVVIQSVGGREMRRKGRVVRLQGDLDPVGRMAQLLVAVPTPLETGGDLPPLPLFLQSYVSVELTGRTLEKAFAVPRVALREGRQVWIMNAKDELEPRDVEIAWRTEDAVLVTDGISAEDRVITSRLAAPVTGMKLRVAGSEPAPSGGEDTAPSVSGGAEATPKLGDAAPAEVPVTGAPVTAEADHE